MEAISVGNIEASSSKGVALLVENGVKEKVTNALTVESVSCFHLNGAQLKKVGLESIEPSFVWKRSFTKKNMGNGMR